MKKVEARISDPYNPFSSLRRRRIKVLKEMAKNSNITTEKGIIKYCLGEFGVRLDTAKSYLAAVKADDSIKLEG